MRYREDYRSNTLSVTFDINDAEKSTSYIFEGYNYVTLGHTLNVEAKGLIVQRGDACSLFPDKLRFKTAIAIS